VLDCLEGLQAARDRKWLQEYHTFDLEGWRLLRQKFDASWLIPGEVLAMANPTGTARNPNFPGLLAPSNPSTPKTPGRLPPLVPKSPTATSIHSSTSQASLQSAMTQRAGFESLSISNPGTPNSSMACFDAWEQQELFEEVLDEHNAVPVEMQMTIDVGPGPGDWSATPDSRAANLRPPALSLPSTPGSCCEAHLLGGDTFASMFKRHNVTCVVRLNLDFECPEQLRHEEFFKKSGCQVKQDPFNDGDTPTKAIALAFSSTCHETCGKRGKAVAVHCMGGLGRTGVIVGTYAVSHHKVSGKAFHGWSRICRPGTVQTPKQEVFLRSLEPKRRSQSPSFNNLLELVRSRLPSF